MRTRARVWWVAGRVAKSRGEGLLVDDEEAAVNLYAEASGCGRSLPESEITISPDSNAWTRSQGTKADVVDPAGTLAAAVDDLGAEQVSQAHARLPAVCR